VEYLDLADIDAKEAEKRLLGAVGTARADKKESEPLLPVSAGTREEILAKRKQEMDQLYPGEPVRVRENHVSHLCRRCAAGP